jgi:hypothetical protein
MVGLHQPNQVPDMLALTERDHRRYQQIAASIYPVVLVYAGVYFYTADPQTGIGAGFVLIMAIMAPTGAAFFAAGLVIIINGLYAYQGGSSDRVSLAVALAIVGGLAPSVYLGWTMAGTRPLLLMVMYVIFALVCPLALFGVVFNIFSRVSGKVSNAWIHVRR